MLMTNSRFVFRDLASRSPLPDDGPPICRDHAIAQTEYAQIDRWGFEFLLRLFVLLRYCVNRG
jgi:hypothetical protein